MGEQDEVKKTERVNYKTVLVSALVSLLMCVIVACVLFTVIIKNKNGDADAHTPVIEAGDVLPSGATAPSETGGTADLTLSDGTKLTYTIPSDMYRLETDYVGLINAGYSLDTPLSTTNLIVIGNANNVNQAGSAVVAMPMSETYKVFEHIYGEDFEGVSKEDIESPILTYVRTGELPEVPYVNYEMNERDAIEKDGITYRVFEQSYDVEAEETINVKQICAYSDTEDVIEIVVDDEDGSFDKAYARLKEFIG